MTLREHINTEHGGIISAFCRSTGVSHTQASRWLGYGCDWVDGKVKRTLWPIDSAVVTKDIK